MTRTEALTKKETNAKAAIAAHKKELARVRAEQRTDEKKALAKRALIVGHLAGKAGLFAWDDPTLHQVFCVIAQVVETPNPVAVLQGLLAEAVRQWA